MMTDSERGMAADLVDECRRARRAERGIVPPTPAKRPDLVSAGVVLAGGVTATAHDTAFYLVITITWIGIWLMAASMIASMLGAD